MTCIMGTMKIKKDWAQLGAQDIYDAIVDGSGEANLVYGIARMLRRGSGARVRNGIVYMSYVPYTKGRMTRAKGNKKASKRRT